MKESDFQKNFKKKVLDLFPNCMILKNDPTHIQGIPDLTILNNDRWAVLEVKRNKKAHIQPNQPHYVERLNNMGYSTFVYPENEEEVLDGLKLYFNS